jgi:hypothetical protein
MASTTQGVDFQEIKRCKRHISNNTLQTAKKSTKPVPTSAAVKLPPKAGLTRNFFTSLRTTDIYTETTGAEKTPPEQEPPRIPDRPPAVVMTSTTNLIRLQSYLNSTSKESTSFEIHDMEPVSLQNK